MIVAYVEILRLRRALVWYGGVAVLLLVISTLVSMDRGGGNGNDLVSWGILFGVGGYSAMIFGTVIAPSLNKENDGVEMVWTKPIARERIAVSYVLADLIGIVVAGTIAMAVMIAHMMIVHHQFSFAADPRGASIGILALGVAFMWYGLLQVATCWYSGRAGMVVGLSWGVFAILAGLSHVPPGAFHTLVMLLNVINPLAYLTSINITLSNPAGYVETSVFSFELGTRIVIVWIIAFASMAGAVFAWRRLET